MGLFFKTRNEKLVAACKKGKLDTVKKLLAAGAEVNGAVYQFLVDFLYVDTPLCTAIHYKRTEVVSYLLDHKADPNLMISYPHPSKISPLYLACEKGDEEIITILLERSAQINIQCTNGRTPLHMIIASESCDEVRMNVLKKMFEKGAYPNPKSQTGETPLHIAAQQGNLDIVKFLAAHGADISLRDNAGNTPADAARSKAHNAVAAYLDENQNKKQLAAEQLSWKLTGKDTISRTSDIPGYRLTTVFNFTDRQYIHISRNVETGVESSHVTFFDDIPDENFIWRKYDVLIQLGGEAPSPVIKMLLKKA